MTPYAKERVRQPLVVRRKEVLSAAEFLVVANKKYAEVAVCEEQLSSEGHDTKDSFGRDGGTK
jgi:hypothetical protein